MPSIRLSEYDNKRIAVQFTLGTFAKVLRGRGQFLTDEFLGQVLRIELDDLSAAAYAAPAILMQQGNWCHPFVEDREHGCDYLVRVTGMS